MKKKHRDISVNGIKYCWTNNNNFDGDGSNRISIWLNKKIIHNEIFGGDIQITPKLVVEIIGKLNS